MFFYELKKIWVSRKNRILWILYIVSILFYATEMYEKCVQNKSETITYCNQWSMSYLTMAEQLEALSTGVRNTVKQNEFMEQAELFYRLSELFQKKANYLAQGEKEKIVPLQIEITQKELEAWSNKQFSTAEQRTIICETLKKYQEYLELVKQNQTYIWDVYEWNGFNFVYRFVNSWLPFWLVVYPFLLLSDSISGEYEHGSLKLLLSQPYKKVIILWDKIAAGFISIVIHIVLPIIIVMLVINAGREWDYSQPVLLVSEDLWSRDMDFSQYSNDTSILFCGSYKQNNTYEKQTYMGISNFSYMLEGYEVKSTLEYTEFKGIWQVELLYLPLILLCSFMFSAMCIFVSLIGKKIRISFLLSICIVSVLIAGSCSPNAFCKWNPAIYAFIGSILSGNHSNTLYQGIIVEGMYTVSFLVGSIILFKKKEFV